MKNFKLYEILYGFSLYEMRRITPLYGNYTEITRNGLRMSVLLLPENQAESLGHQRQKHTAQSGASGHGGVAHPRSH